MMPTLSSEQLSVVWSQAQIAVKAHLETRAGELGSHFHFMPALKSQTTSIQLPDGWRFPCDLYRFDFRVPSASYIVFVSFSEPLKVKEEWDSTRYCDDVKKDIEWLSTVKEDDIQLPLLTEVAAMLETKLPGAYTETSERVWLPAKVEREATSQTRGQIQYIDNRKCKLAWHLHLVEAGRRYKMFAWQDSVGQIQSSAPELIPSYLPALDILDDLPPEVERYISRGTQHLSKPIRQNLASVPGRSTILACMVKSTNFIRKLMYLDIELYDVMLRYDRGAQQAETNWSGDRLVITLAQEWDEASTIIIHELGHVFWAMTFTTRADRVLTQTTSDASSSIEEGFADYFAASILVEQDSTVAKPVSIGSDLKRFKDDQGFSKGLILPRQIDSSPPPELDSKDEHYFGWKWANLLWDLRTRLIASGVDSDTANQIILQAHIRPEVRPEVKGYAALVACYLQALKIKSQNATALIDFNDLANTHRILT